MKNAILFLVLLFNHAIFSQQKENGDNRIVVLGQATLDLPADQITFTVLISVKDASDLEKINQNHKTKEKEILKLLKEFKIPQNKISYSLLEIRKDINYNKNEEKEFIVAEQRVSFTVDSIQQYTNIQTQLLKNGFTEFSSSFGSSKIVESEKILLEKALKSARNKAEIMAKFAKKGIVEIVKIADTEDTEPILSNESNHARFEVKGDIEVANPSLTQIAQKISISKTVKVVFKIK
ncbi:SIMPL domain-containing protein [Arcicella aquatica]|uniref:SIMPL domain-containing protein n=1 Tax=Arcicella aquatica TaxID=217141 RepID=A0ABU5QSS8_9BACT|nr:SIMPL domain-containing protein [Arcicella aquatica]MEA5260160.1 SIMPL domain-containing protein [Arcicella aquatica]